MAPLTAAKYARTKGEDTRSQILTVAVQQASESGFESLTIGGLADKTGMSKSGLFAHFGSKLELQIAALDEAGRAFTEAVFFPALKAPRGLKRLRVLFDSWVKWPQSASLPGGCPVESASHEYHHQPGAMRDAVVERQALLDRELAKTVQMAVDTGELAAGTDARQLAFEMVSIILGFYRTKLLLGPEESAERARTAFERLISHHTR